MVEYSGRALAPGLTRSPERLYKVSVKTLTLTEAMDFAQREYGATPEQVAALQEAVDNRYRQLRRSGKLLTVTVGELSGLLEEDPLP